MNMDNLKSEFDYDAWALKQAEDKGRASLLSQKAQLLADLVPWNVRFENALEIGCAEGIVINGLREMLHIKKCYGLDVCSTFIKIGRLMHSEIEFIQTSGIRIPFSDKSIDLVILSDIIEHIEDLDLFLREVKRVGRTVLLKVPLDKYLWRKLISEPLGRSYSVGPCHPDGHVHEFSKSSCEKMLKKMNFSIISSKVIYFSSGHKRKHPLIRLRWFLDDKLKLLVPNFAHRIFGGCLIAFLGIDDDQTNI
jgi:hypothetical protein